MLSGWFLTGFETILGFRPGVTLVLLTLSLSGFARLERL
ncbi:hypothetical protein HMPREF9278_1258 [Mobiluncus mulieris FB024-16]|nr:hypothetical protein HMPREF9278_1258 [Mobiluncus mulieris FB024-16]